MLFDRPARFLYRHGWNLYQPMHAFASEYRWIVRIVVILAFAWLARELLTNPRVLLWLGIMPAIQS